ncbi:hypothetical protein HD806DRAFT_363852 [Xylariaceae sp. AK1471]|nr:hypothetical protein HD806DRAFT_363852 [Xylariaceae sp. AK1471]
MTFSSSSSANTTAYLKATYSSPTTAHEPLTLSSTPLDFPVPASLTVDDKTAYLRSLRTATIALQERINAELTTRMEEDNKNALEQSKNTQGGVDGVTKKTKTQTGAVVDEAAEEENYGEEVQEEEEV